MAEKLYKSENWYKFLSSLYFKFSEYEIQKERKKYNVADIDDWGKSGKRQGIKINKNNLMKFWNKTVDYNITEFDDMKTMTMTNLQFEELNHILNLTLNHRMHIRCIEPYIIVTGDYISIRDISDDMLTYVDDNCMEFLLNGNIVYINVFALNTFFIDDDVPMFTEMAITVIAPKWEVIGTRKIELYGLKGKSADSTTETSWFSISFTSKTSKAKDSAYPSGKGADGKPGGAGGVGGKFLGIGEDFINGASLTITAIGGTGGPGQDGGNGGNGTDGSSPTVPSNISCREDLCDKGKQINLFKCRKEYCTRVSPELRGFLSYDHLYCDYKILGIPGNPGGRGGDGGRGGKGGHPGNITLIALNKDSGIVKYTNKGEEGRNGKGGIGGIGGNNGDDIRVSCNDQQVWWSSWHLLERIHNRNISSGRDGINGANMRNIELSKQSKIVPKWAKNINQYKNYLTENLIDRFKKSSLMKFLRKLESDKNVKNTYDTLGLIQEYRILEDQFRILKKDVDFLPLYQSLLNRISEYSQAPKEITSIRDYKKVLRYLYTATLGRVQNLKYNLESNLIINVYADLDFVKKDIDKLKGLEISKNKVDIIYKYKQKYKEKIVKKIDEAEEIISKEITPEIDNVDNQIDNKIGVLINEVIQLQEQTKAEHKKLTEKKQNLENALIYQGLFSSIKIIGQVLSVLGPYGQVAGSVIEMGSTMAESFVLGSQDNENNILELPQSISDSEMLKDRIKNIKTQKINRLSKLLEHVSQEVNKHPEKLSNISVKIIDIQDKLNKVNESKYKLKEIQDLESELEAVFQTQEMELKKSQTDSSDVKTVKALIVLDNFKKAIKFGEVIFDTINKYKNNQSKLDAINEVIEQAEEKFKSLKQYEQNIYDTIIPLMQSMENDLDNITNNLGTKSKVGLDVTKWRVQNYLSDIKFQMEQLTRGFEAKDDLARYVEKLREAIFTLLIVYKHIQDYQEHQTFSNLVANISSITVDEIDIIKDPILGEELRHDVRDLKIVVTSSIILQLYQTTIEAFKQFVFPFAHFYFEGIVLPTHLKLENNRNSSDVDSVVDQISREINHIKSGLESYNKSVINHDRCIGRGYFNSNDIAIQPFFVWRNEQHKIMISKLLSGEEVLVKADILNSMTPQEDAIKFRAIELNFKTKNETMQSEINKILKAFKVSMTHLGDSHYRYNAKIYQITTSSQYIWYYFAKANGEPIRKSASYIKIKNGDFVLSPYALWKLKLSVLRNSENFSFKDLERYKNEIDLELCGLGYYVDQTEDDCLNLKVEEYYKTITTYDQLDVNARTDMEKDVPLSQNSDQKRNKRDINHEFDTTVDLTSDDMIAKNKPQCIFHTGGEILEISDCATNSASPSISSPVNNICNWVKESSFELLSNVLTSFSILPSAIVKKISVINVVTFNDIFEVISLTSRKKETISNASETYCNSMETETTLENRHVMYEETMYDKYYDALESLSPAKEVNVAKKIKPGKTLSPNSEMKPQVDFYMDNIREFAYEETGNRLDSTTTYNDNYSYPLLTYAENCNSMFFQSFQAHECLMLVDVITRSITGETICKQSVPLSPMQEKAFKLYGIEQKVCKGLQKMTALYGDVDLDF